MDKARLQALVPNKEELEHQLNSSKLFRETLKKYLTNELDRAILESEKVDSLANPAFIHHNAGQRKTLRDLLKLIN